jgi:hypothetical protein
MADLCKAKAGGEGGEEARRHALGYNATESNKETHANAPCLHPVAFLLISSFFLLLSNLLSLSLEMFSFTVRVPRREESLLYSMQQQLYVFYPSFVLLPMPTVVGRLSHRCFCFAQVKWVGAVCSVCHRDPCLHGCSTAEEPTQYNTRWLPFFCIPPVCDLNFLHTARLLLQAPMKDVFFLMF